MRTEYSPTNHEELIAQLSQDACRAADDAAWLRAFAELSPYMKAQEAEQAGPANAEHILLSQIFQKPIGYTTQLILEEFMNNPQRPEAVSKKTYQRDRKRVAAYANSIAASINELLRDSIRVLAPLVGIGFDTAKAGLNPQELQAAIEQKNIGKTAAETNRSKILKMSELLFQNLAQQTEEAAENTRQVFAGIVQSNRRAIEGPLGKREKWLLSKLESGEGSSQATESPKNHIKAVQVIQLVNFLKHFYFCQKHLLESCESGLFSLHTADANSQAGYARLKADFLKLKPYILGIIASIAAGYLNAEIQLSTTGAQRFDTAMKTFRDCLALLPESLRQENHSLLHARFNDKEFPWPMGFFSCMQDLYSALSSKSLKQVHLGLPRIEDEAGLLSGAETANFEAKTVEALFRKDGGKLTQLVKKRGLTEYQKKYQPKITSEGADLGSFYLPDVTIYSQYFFYSLEQSSNPQEINSEWAMATQVHEYIVRAIHELKGQNTMRALENLNQAASLYHGMEKTKALTFNETLYAYLLAVAYQKVSKQSAEENVHNACCKSVGKLRKCYQSRIRGRLLTNMASQVDALMSEIELEYQATNLAEKQLKALLAQATKIKKSKSKGKKASASSPGPASDSETESEEEEEQESEKPTPASAKRADTIEEALKYAEEKIAEARKLTQLKDCQPSHLNQAVDTLHTATCSLDRHFTGNTEDLPNMLIIRYLELHDCFASICNKRVMLSLSFARMISRKIKAAMKLFDDASKKEELDSLNKEIESALDDYEKRLYFIISNLSEAKALYEKIEAHLKSLPDEITTPTEETIKKKKVLEQIKGQKGVTEIYKREIDKLMSELEAWRKAFKLANPEKSETCSAEPPLVLKMAHTGQKQAQSKAAKPNPPPLEKSADLNESDDETDAETDADAKSEFEADDPGQSEQSGPLRPVLKRDLQISNELMGKGLKELMQLLSSVLGNAKIFLSGGKAWSLLNEQLHQEPIPTGDLDFYVLLLDSTLTRAEVYQRIRATPDFSNLRKLFEFGYRFSYLLGSELVQVDLSFIIPRASHDEAIAAVQKNLLLRNTAIFIDENGGITTTTPAGMQSGVDAVRERKILVNKPPTVFYTSDPTTMLHIPRQLTKVLGLKNRYTWDPDILASIKSHLDKFSTDESLKGETRGRLWAAFRRTLTGPHAGFAFLLLLQYQVLHALFPALNTLKSTRPNFYKMYINFLHNRVSNHAKLVEILAYLKAARFMAAGDFSLLAPHPAIAEKEDRLVPIEYLRAILNFLEHYGAQATAADWKRSSDQQFAASTAVTTTKQSVSPATAAAAQGVFSAPSGAPGPQVPQTFKN